MTLGAAPAARTVATLLLAAGLAACGPAEHPAGSTATMGSARPHAASTAPLDGQGRPLAPPPLPLGTEARLTRAAPGTALALWVQDGHAMAALHTPAAGWSAGQPLEDIFGEASDARIASNGQGAAMAVWRHTVGKIESLRFSHWTAATGWSAPDVMPGALPRPRSAGADAAPRLEMDAAGHAYAHWASGFDEGATQSARFTTGQGWTRALDEPAMAAAGAASAPPGRSSSGTVR